MKKVIFILIAVFVIIFTGILFHKTRGVRLSMEKVLPSEPIFYFHISDVEGVKNELIPARLWKNMAEIDVEKVLEMSEVPAQVRAKVQKFREEASIIFSDPLVEKLFGQEVSAAVYPAGGDISNILKMKDVPPEVIFATRVQGGVKFAEFVYKILGSSDSQLQITEKVYEGYGVNSFKLSDKLTITYVKIKDLLIIGMSEESVLLCVDVALHKRKSLFQDDRYSVTEAELPDNRDILGYIRVDALASYLKQISGVLASVPSLQKGNFSEVYNKMKGFYTFGYAQTLGDLSESKTVVMFDKKEVSSNFRKICSVKPQKNHALRFIPKGIIAYNWSNWFDANAFWEKFQGEKSRMKTALPVSQIADIDEKWREKIENEIIPAIDNEIGIVVKDIDSTGLFPVPEAFIFLEVTDTSDALQIMDALTKENNLSFFDETYRDVPIKYMTIPFISGLEPAYCVIDGYLLVSTSRQMLKGCVDSYNDEKLSILADPVFKAVDFGITNKNNSTSFLRPDILFGRVEDLVKKATGLMSLAVTPMSRKITKQGIEEMQRDVEEMEGEISDLKKKSRELRSEKSETLSAEERDKELARMQNTIGEKEKQLTDGRKKIEEEKARWERNTQSMANARTRYERMKFYTETILFPVLDGLKAYKAIGQRAVIEDGHIDKFSYSRIEK